MGEASPDSRCGLNGSRIKVTVGRRSRHNWRGCSRRLARAAESAYVECEHLLWRTHWPQLQWMSLLLMLLQGAAADAQSAVPLKHAQSKRGLGQVLSIMCLPGLCGCSLVREDYARYRLSGGGAPFNAVSLIYFSFLASLHRYEMCRWWTRRCGARTRRSRATPTPSSRRTPPSRCPPLRIFGLNPHKCRTL